MLLPLTRGHRLPWLARARETLALFCSTQVLACRHSAYPSQSGGNFRPLAPPRTNLPRSLRATPLARRAPCTALAVLIFAAPEVVD